MVNGNKNDHSFIKSHIGTMIEVYTAVSHLHSKEPIHILSIFIKKSPRHSLLLGEVHYYVMSIM